MCSRAASEWYVRVTVCTADNEANTGRSEALFEAQRAENKAEDRTVFAECPLCTVTFFQNIFTGKKVLLIFPHRPVFFHIVQYYFKYWTKYSIFFEYWTEYSIIFKYWTEYSIIFKCGNDFIQGLKYEDANFWTRVLEVRILLTAIFSFELIRFFFKGKPICIKF